MVAIVDLITAGEDDTWKVTEFKTSGRAYGESEVATSLQPTCYVHAIAAVCLDTNVCNGGWLTALDTTTGRYWQSNELGELRDGQLKIARG